jgi:hypothetical protein
MPTDPSFDLILKAIGGGSIGALLLAILYGGWKAKPWWLFATSHERIVAVIEKAAKEAIDIRDKRIAEQDVELRETRKLVYQLMGVTKHVIEAKKEEAPRD